MPIPKSNRDSGAVEECRSMNANVKDASDSKSIRVFEAREDIRCVPPAVNNASVVPKFL